MQWNIHNPMMTDFGAGNLTSSEAFDSYVKQIMSNFTAIVVAEHLDESLVVLKNKLCWDWSDVVYVPVNQAKYSFDHTNQSVLAERRINYKLISPFDFLLYKQALQKLHKDMESIEHFEEQLNEFKILKARISKWCMEHNGKEFNETYIETRYDSDGITFSAMDCARMKSDLIAYVEDVMERRYSRDPNTQWWTSPHDQGGKLQT